MNFQTVNCMRRRDLRLPHEEEVGGSAEPQRGQGGTPQVAQQDPTRGSSHWPASPTTRLASQPVRCCLSASSANVTEHQNWQGWWRIVA